MPHLGDGHVAALEARETLEPSDVAVVEHAAIVGVTLDVGHQAAVAVELERLVGHAALLAHLLHGVEFASGDGAGGWPHGGGRGNGGVAGGHPSAIERT